MGDIADCVISDELVISCSPPVAPTRQDLSAVPDLNDEVVISSSPLGVASPGLGLLPVPGFALSPVPDLGLSPVPDLDPDSTFSLVSFSSSDSSSDSDDDNYYIPADYGSGPRDGGQYQSQYHHHVAESPDEYSQSDPHHIRESIEGDAKLANSIEGDHQLAESVEGDHQLAEELFDYSTIDPHLLSILSEPTHQQPAQTKQANSLVLAGGLNLHEFVLRCSEYIDQHLPSGQIERAELGWSHIGQIFAIPGTSMRPPALSYLVGPRIGPPTAQQHQFWNQQQVPGHTAGLRTHLTKRKDRSEHEESVARFTPRRQAQPLRSCLANPLRPSLALPRKIFEQAQYQSVSEVWCSHVLDWLHHEVRMRMCQAEPSLAIADLKSERTAILRHYSLGPNGGINLAQFVINPRSFAQTLENLAHLTLLAQDGSVQVKSYDTHLATAKPVEDNRAFTARPPARWPAGKEIIPMDRTTWKVYVRFYNIVVPMIPHRAPNFTISKLSV